jgi:hypothetical protein
LDFYNLGRDSIAKKLNHTGPKTTAAIQIFNIKNDSECFKQIKVGNTPFDRYSQKALEKIKDGLKKKLLMKYGQNIEINKLEQIATKLVVLCKWYWKDSSNFNKSL